MTYETSGLEARTHGLGGHGHPELICSVADEALVPEAAAFLEHVVYYLFSQRARIQPGETLTHGYWLTKFQRADDGLDVWEYNAPSTEFVRGASLTLTYWRDQHAVCARYGATFTPPRPDTMAVISQGVVTGDPVEGVRYPSPSHMSGWWLTTDRYDGDTTSLEVTHLYHVTAARPDIAAYVCLPYGFCFGIGNDRSYAHFDPEVANQPP